MGNEIENGEAAAKNKKSRTNGPGKIADFT
jgi:hypothetical protein